MRYFLIHFSLGLKFLPAPFAQFMRKHYTFYMKGDHFPSAEDIKNKARKINKNLIDYSLLSISEVPSNFRAFDLEEIIEA